MSRLFQDTSKAFAVSPTFTGNPTVAQTEALTTFNNQIEAYSQQTKQGVGSKVVFDTSGNAYWAVTSHSDGVTWSQTAYIYKVTPSGTLTTFASAATKGAQHCDLAFDASGNLFWAVTNFLDSVLSTNLLLSYVYKITPSGVMSTFASITTSAGVGAALAFDASGNLYWSVTNYNAVLPSYVYKITPAGTLTTFASAGSLRASVSASLVFDTSGNLFWALINNTNDVNGITTSTQISYIYKITPAGVMTTFASVTTDSGYATHLVIDTSNVLYWAITNITIGAKSYLYSVTPTGVITVLASSVIRSSLNSFSRGTSIVLTSSAIYWAIGESTGGVCIKKIDNLNAVTTITTLPSGVLYGNNSLAFDTNGYLWFGVAKYSSGNTLIGNSYLYKYDVTQANYGVVRQLADYYSAPSSLSASITAVAAMGTAFAWDVAGNLYWAVTFYHNAGATNYSVPSYVYKITPSGTVTQIASSTNAGAFGTSLAFDSIGNLYWAVANRYNGTTNVGLAQYIYKITPAGVQTTFATVTSSHSVNTSLAIDANNNVFWAVTNYFNGTTYTLNSNVYRITPAGTLTTFATQSTIGGFGTKLTFDTAGNLYWAVTNRDAGSNATATQTSYIYKITPAASVSTFASVPSLGSAGTDMVWDSAGNLYWAVGQQFDTSGARNLTSNVYKITPAGKLSTHASAPTFGVFGTSLAIDANDNLYWSNANAFDGAQTFVNCYVYKITPAGVQSTLASQEGLQVWYVGLTVDNTGNLYWAIPNYNTGAGTTARTSSINKYAVQVSYNSVANSTPALLPSYASPSASFKTPSTGGNVSNVVVDASGNKFWAVTNYWDLSTHMKTSYVYKVTPNGIQSTFASVSTTGAFSSALVFDTSGNLFWAVGNYSDDVGNLSLTSYVYKITPSGTLTTFASQATVGAWQSSLAIDASNNLYWAISSYYNTITFNLTSYVYKITSAGAISQFTSASTSGAWGSSLAIDGSGNVYWAVNNSNDGATTLFTSYVYKITPAGSQTTFASQATNYALGNSLAWDSTGNLYWAIAQLGANSSVYKITSGGTKTLLSSVSADVSIDTSLAFNAQGSLYWAISNYQGSASYPVYNKVYKIENGTANLVAQERVLGSYSGSIIFDQAGTLNFAVGAYYSIGSFYALNSYFMQYKTAVLDNKAANTAQVTNAIKSQYSYYSAPILYQSQATNGAYSTDLVFDSAGNMYWAIANYFNDVNFNQTSYVYKITPDGTRTVFASQPFAGATATSLAFDTSGNLYWALHQGFNGTDYSTVAYVFKITTSGTMTAFGSVSTQGSYQGSKLIFDTAGNLYWGICNYYNGTTYNLTSYIYKITPGGVLTTFASAATVGSQGVDLEFDAYGNLYWSIASLYNGTTFVQTSYVYKINPYGTMTTLASQVTNGGHATNLAWDSTGNLYWAIAHSQNQTSTIHKISPTGNMTAFATETGVSSPTSTNIILGPDNNFYWMVTPGNINSLSKLYKVDMQGNVKLFATFPVQNAGTNDTALVFDLAENLFVANIQTLGSSWNNTCSLYQFSKLTVN